MNLSASITAFLLASGFTGGAAFVPSSLTTSPQTTRLNVAVKEWSPTSWTNDDVVAKQMPEYESQEELEDAIQTLNKKAPLVFAGEVRRLHDQLAQVSQGQGFVLMGGDCAESFKEFNVNHIRDTFQVMMQMALVLTFGSSQPVVKIGRMAGQFAKPRSTPMEEKDGVSLPSYRGDNVNCEEFTSEDWSDGGQFAKPRSTPMEEKDGVSLPSYRGDNVNCEEFTAEGRRNNPHLMVDAYDQSAQTLNLLRAFSTGGFADISRLQAWNLDFVEDTDEGSRYRSLAAKVDESMRFMKAVGIDTASQEFTTVDFYTAHETLNILRAFSTGGFADISRLQAWNLDFVEDTDEGSRYRNLATKVDESMRFMKAIGIDTASQEFTTVDFYTAHECLLLPYEQALTRKDSTTGKYYDCSSHMLWVGERTRDLDSAHLEFTRGIGNPLGVKVSDKCTTEELISTIETMNPLNTPGKLSIIVRMGAEKLRKHLPELIRAVQREGKAVVWISDPMHGNTFATKNGYKTRDFEAIRAELSAFFDVHEAMGSHPGGVHLEMTGDDVTECIGGVSDVSEETLKDAYNTTCDPRLNGVQALELAFLIAEGMRRRAGLPPL
eukprot:CAMPEP_0201901848 /NCGR_PEP_ID=MMETSP0902-20130614/54645_1 /ASSEMBLY_ACC=CAM_ASM_000551 /TAXON_ID=420261 /ORGANISM="Thalassiosira antarctica, Strain CCMP982" /LENGTH=605 /DNA_ID=CAMNT_0048435827 /DNA_START=68 /DNA_END=1886 /DNA_ORIENTATION=-